MLHRAKAWGLLSLFERVEVFGGGVFDSLPQVGRRSPVEALPSAGEDWKHPLRLVSPESSPEDLRCDDEAPPERTHRDIRVCRHGTGAQISVVSIELAVAVARAGSARHRDSLLERFNQLEFKSLALEQQLDLLRAYGLIFIRLGGANAATKKHLVETLNPLYPAGVVSLDHELCQMLLYLNAPGAASRSVGQLLAAEKQSNEMFYAYHLRTMTKELLKSSTQSEGSPSSSRRLESLSATNSEMMTSARRPRGPIPAAARTPPVRMRLSQGHLIVTSIGRQSLRKNSCLRDSFRKRRAGGSDPSEVEAKRRGGQVLGCRTAVLNWNAHSSTRTIMHRRLGGGTHRIESRVNLLHFLAASPHETELEDLPVSKRELLRNVTSQRSLDEVEVGLVVTSVAV